MGTLDNIINVMKEKKISQKELCNSIGVSKQTFTNWKNGWHSSYKKYLPQIAEVLGVSVDTLLGREQNNNTSDNFYLTEHEKKVMTAYRQNVDTQPYVDKLLGIEEENNSIQSKFA